MMKALSRLIETMQSLHHSSLVTNTRANELALPRRLIPASTIENTSKNRKNTTKLADE
jgi:hypothetical protein